MRIIAGLVGCGFIGHSIARFLSNHPSISLESVCDPSDEAVERVNRLFPRPPARQKLEELIESCQLIIEAATIKAAGEILELAVYRSKDILIISVGGALACRSDWRRNAADCGSRVFIPSGSIAGLDALKGALQAEVSSVKIITRKPPAALAGAPKIVADGIDLTGLSEPLEVFSGTAREAVSHFPQNINVAAALSLAGIGPDRTMVSLIADPSLKNNVHQVEIRGESGIIRTVSENRPSPDNPKTSHLAALSTIATLKNIYSSVQIGT
ncbi:MAG: aspartate dehydrogenase domain-containing protein [bacterium]